MLTNYQVYASIIVRVGNQKREKLKEELEG